MANLNNKNSKGRKIREQLAPILKKNGVIKAGIFGSFARGEQNKSSDVDLLIQFKGGKSLFDLVGLERELKDTFNRKFDVITYNSIHPLLKERILKDEMRIL